MYLCTTLMCLCSNPHVFMHYTHVFHMHYTQVFMSNVHVFMGKCYIVSCVFVIGNFNNIHWKQAVFP